MSAPWLLMPTHHPPRPSEPSPPSTSIHVSRCLSATLSLNDGAMRGVSVSRLDSLTLPQDLYFHFRQHPSKSSSLPLEYRDPISTLPASSRVPNFDRLPRSPSAPIKHYRPPGDRSTWTINQYLTYKRARAAAKDKMLYELREEERWSQTRVKLEEGVVWYHGSKRDRVGLIPAKGRGKAGGQKTGGKGKAMESGRKLAGGDVGVGEGSPGAGSAGRVKVRPRATVCETAEDTVAGAD